MYSIAIHYLSTIKPIVSTIRLIFSSIRQMVSTIRPIYSTIRLTDLLVTELILITEVSKQNANRTKSFKKDDYA